MVAPECGMALAKVVLDAGVFKTGVMGMWRFKGTGKLEASVNTTYNGDYKGHLRVVKVDFSGWSLKVKGSCKNLFSYTV